MKATEDKLALARNGLTRWEQRSKKAFRVMVRADKEIERLRRYIGRLERKLTIGPQFKAEADECETGVALTKAIETHLAEGDGLDVPPFLQRAPKPRPIDKDEAAAAKLREEIEARKTAKTRARIEKMKAKKSGETKKMPLSGPDALAVLRGLGH